MKTKTVSSYDIRKALDAAMKHVDAKEERIRNNTVSAITKRKVIRNGKSL
ncbi:hypothetical protein MAH1_22190 [Sessilibacter sp. MAH1]